MNIRHVQFPCGRRGLEVESQHIGGSEITFSYAYFYNGSTYHNVALNAGIKLKHDYYGRIEGLVVLRDQVNVRDLICASSPAWA